MTSLKEYQQKRRFNKTPEPEPRKKRSASGHLFVVQKHSASNLHYDFRIESEGVLKSWAVPKGPSLNPADKRLAMAVEDHPLEYAFFEGIIPKGEYGGGTVMVWDHGTYRTENAETVSAALKKGELKFRLDGTKLKGSWVLVRMRDRNWLLFKHRDRFASAKAITELEPFSVLSGRSLAEIATDEGGDVTQSAARDASKASRRLRASKSTKGSKSGIARR
jgi:bifunctional non-homologous end joining protein LigD